MKIKKLVIFGFGNYKKEVEIDFSQMEEEKTYCLVTGENGVGKSMLFELIVNCLTNTGRVSNLKELCNKDIIEQGKDCFVRLHLDDEKSSEYVIEKIIESNRLSLYIEFYRIDKNGKRFDIASGNKESRKAIEEFIQIDSNSIYDSIYSSQGELLSFFYRTPDEARRIIMNLLGTEQYLDKSKSSFSISRALNSRLKELEEERGIKIEKTEEEIKEEIENTKEEIKELEKKEKNKNYIEEIKNEEFDFDDYLNLKEEYSSLEDKEFNEEEVESDLIKLRNSLKEKEKEIYETQNYLNRKKEIEKKLEIINEEIKSKNKNSENNKIEDLENSKEKLKKLIEDRKREETTLNTNKERNGKEIEKLEGKLKELKGDKEEFSSEEIINKAEILINKLGVLNEEFIEELKESEETLSKKREELVGEYSSLSKEIKKLESLKKSQKIIKCACCNSIVSEENLDHFHSFIKKHKLESEYKIEDKEKIQNKIEELKKSQNKVLEEGIELRRLIEFIKSILSLNEIKKESLEIENKLKEIENSGKSIKELEEDLKKIEDSIIIAREIKRIKEDKKELLSEIERINDNIGERTIEDLEKNKEEIENLIKEKEEQLVEIRKVKEIKNKFEISKLKYEKLIEKIKSYSGKKLDESNFLEEYKKIKEEDSNQDFKVLIVEKEEELTKNESILTEIKKNKELNKKIDYLSREKMYYDHLGEIYDFIAKDLYKKALPLIKSIVNDKLSISSQGKYQFHIETEKDGKEVFIPKVHLIGETINEARSVNTLSGGEATWVATALREAFTMLASRRSGFQWSFGVFDETFGNQDGDHLDSLIEALMKNSFLKQVFLITHDNEAKEKIRELGGQELILYKDEDGDTQVKFVSY